MKIHYNSDKWENEVELGEAVVAYFRSQGWKVYPEIEKIDIIAAQPDENAVDGTKIIGVECKKHFNLKVLEQAWSRRTNVDEMWVAVPYGHTSNHFFGSMIAEKFGIGVLYVRKTWSENKYEITVNRQPVYVPRKLKYVDKLLDPEAETYCKAGQCGGKEWTKFRQTVAKLIKYVEENPGCDPLVAIKGIKHHYASHGGARSNLIGFVKGGKVITELVLENNRLYLRKNLVDSINKE